MFNIHDSKPMKVHIPIGVNLCAEQCPKTQEEEEDMSYVPYASAVGSLMYVIFCTRPDIAHAVGVLSRFMSTRKGALDDSQEGFQVFVWH